MIPLTNIHQIEMTSRCNLACVYCVHPIMPRAKLDMSDAVFDRALAWVEFFIGHGTQYAEVNFTGIGEAFLHPAVVERIAEAKRRFSGLHVVIPTNGLLLTDAIAEKLAPLGVRLWISMHVPVKAAKAVEIARRHGILEGAALDPVSSGNDWAGQVEWTKPAYRMKCPWLHGGWGFVAADGRIFTCSLDGSGDSTLGHVNDLPAPIPTRRWKLCTTCYQDPPENA